MINKTILEFALKGLEAERQRIDSEIENVKRLLGTGRGSRSKKTSTRKATKKAAAPKTAATKKRGPMSEKQKKVLSRKLKKVWAEKKRAAK